jgi:hypothetical protein
MSYPYEDDLMFGSEAATCNQIQRVIIEGGSEPSPEPVQAVYWKNSTQFTAKSMEGLEVQALYKIEADNSNTALMNALDSQDNPIYFNLSNEGKVYIMLATNTQDINGYQQADNLPNTISITLKQRSGDGAGGGGEPTELGSVTLTLVKEEQGELVPLEGDYSLDRGVKLENDSLVRVPPLS